jgi:hypothetical protein
VERPLLGESHERLLGQIVGLLGIADDQGEPSDEPVAVGAERRAQIMTGAPAPPISVANRPPLTEA